MLQYLCINHHDKPTLNHAMWDLNSELNSIYELENK
jgi:hypothetical protein